MTHQNDTETEFVDTSELENLPGYVGYKESWYERKERIEQSRLEATHTFFSHQWDAGFRRLVRIPKEHSSEYLVCDNCRSEATFYMCRPAKALFCRDCANNIRRVWRKQYRANSKWRDGKQSRIMSEIHKRVESEKSSE